MKKISISSLSFFLILSVITISLGFSTFKADDVAQIEYYAEGQDKSLATILKDVKADNKVPILYFFADWCGPCRRYKKSLSNKRLKESLSNAVLIKIDVDVDDDGIATNYEIREIPTFIKVKEDGTTLARITSNKWDEDTPKKIAPVMDKLVNKGTYDL